MVPGETTLLRWHHTWPDSIKGRISWKNIDSPDWSVVDTAVLLPNLYCPWKPNGYGLAQVRMEIGASTFLSDTFLIAPRISLHVGFDCPDSTFLFWNKTAADAHYQVWGLGYRYLEPLLITSDTFLIFSKNDFPQTHFAVSPVEQGVYGARSAAPAPDKQGAGCYISVFFAELLPERGTVQTGLQLGTLYNVQSVEIQKESIKKRLIKLQVELKRRVEQF